ncbi:MAG: hypothetical protein VR65_17195 [Desulfobulbaceae bacterium BRH_c16a]|nr:MAG: hypothetical protein VR65_17195 [Desulfobulbaceae bacterium BRH_c16a]
MKKKLVLFSICSVFFLLCFSILALLLPSLFEHSLLPRLVQDLPFEVREVSLSRITPWTIRGSFLFAGDDQPGIAAPKFELHYSPGSLFKRKISTLLVDSASLHIDLQSGRPAILGLTTKPAATKQEQAAPAGSLPFAVEKIVLKNVSLTLHRSDKEQVAFIIDSRLALAYRDNQGEREILPATLSGELTARGAPAFTAGLEGRSTPDGYEMDIRLQMPDISGLEGISPSMAELQPVGQLSLTARVTAAESNSNIGYDATATLDRFHLGNTGWAVENRSPNEPVAVHIEGNQDSLRYSLAKVSLLVGPQRNALDMSGDFALTEGRFSAAAEITPEMHGPPLAVSILGSRQPGKIDLRYDLQGEAFTLSDDFSLSSLAAGGDMTIAGTTVSGTLDAQLEKIIAKKEDTVLKDLKLHVPFTYPLPQTAAQGTLSIEEIFYHGVKSGRLITTFAPTATEIAFTGLFTTPLAPKLQLSCDGRAEMSSDFTLSCNIPEVEVRSASLAELVQIPELSFAGKLTAKGELSVKNGTPVGMIQASWHDGTASYGETSLDRIDLDVVFPHLPLVQSSPSQLCTVGSLNFGKVKVTDAEIHFRVESLESVFLEKGGFNWCGGKVDTAGIRLSRTMEAVETTLYCDRLGFTELLSQFGVDDAEGEGSLNGRLPITVSRHGIVFDDGFLFSTPGKSGIVRFQNTKQLAAGMPDLDRAAYLDYSLKALENFSYNWTRLTFTSDKDDLLVKMQLDGEPATPLAFGYREGQIVKSDRGPGIQHPIQLDVNFRLPTKDIFRYGKNIQSLIEK